MKSSTRPALHLAAPALAALALLAGCASTLDQRGLEQRTAQAIGRSVGQFSITDREEETGGRINYTVNTLDGMAYRCYLYGATGFQKAMSFGQTPHSDAICTSMVASKTGSGSPAAATPSAPAAPAAPSARGRGAGPECNALLKAAGRC